MMLEYHLDAFALLGFEPMLSEKSLNEIALFEECHGVVMPPAMREFYSLEGALDLLFEYSNQDSVIAIDELEPADDVLPFQIENQSVCTWGVRLDGSDDPPVVVKIEDKWLPCAPKFSQYIFTNFWDQSRVMKKPYCVQAQNGPLTGRAISTLGANFARQYTTASWPAHMTFRYERDEECLLIWSGAKQADWWLAADTPESLFVLVAQLRDLDNLGANLWSHTEEGSEVLAALRQGDVRQHE